jgi:hypothetical protein
MSVVAWLFLSRRRANGEEAEAGVQAPASAQLDHRSA